MLLVSRMSDVITHSDNRPDRQKSINCSTLILQYNKNSVQGLTFELDVAGDEPDAVHPPDSPAQLAEHAPEDRLREARVRLGRRDEVKELPARDVLEDEQVVRGRAERVDVRDD